MTRSITVAALVMVPSVLWQNHWFYNLFCGAHAIICPHCNVVVQHVCVNIAKKERRFLTATRLDFEKRKNEGGKKEKKNQAKIVLKITFQSTKTRPRRIFMEYNVIVQWTKLWDFRTPEFIFYVMIDTFILQKISKILLEGAFDKFEYFTLFG